MSDDVTAVREKEPDSNDLLADTGKKDEAKHRHRMDYCITICGFAIILLFALGEWLIVTNLVTESAAQDSELLKSFFGLVNSAVMLILGYLFGARKQYIG